MAVMVAMGGAMVENGGVNERLELDWLVLKGDLRPVIARSCSW